MKKPSIKATYVISGIKDQMELMHLSGTLAGWMMLHQNTTLEYYEDHEVNHGNK